MLAVSAPFPNPGCTAYLRGSAQEVRVLGHNADGTATVSLQPPAIMSSEQRFEWARRGASLTRTERRADLFETAHDASMVSAARPKRPARPRRRKPRRA